MVTVLANMKKPPIGPHLVWIEINVCWQLLLKTCGFSPSSAPAGRRLQSRCVLSQRQLFFYTKLSIKVTQCVSWDTQDAAISFLLHWILSLSQITGRACARLHTHAHTKKKRFRHLLQCVCLSVCVLTWTIQTSRQLIRRRQIAAEFLSSLPSLIVYWWANGLNSGTKAPISLEGGGGGGEELKSGINKQNILK